MGKRSRRRKLEERQKQMQRQLELDKPKETNMSNTVITTQTKELKQLKQLGLVMNCVMNHRVVATQHKFEWKGGKLNAVWPSILAFFKWTQDTMRSESQVRLYVHRASGEWKAWAFPQKAKLGMAAHEIDNTDDAEHYAKTQEQRLQFPDHEGWQYWGTVHHHCSSGAFQSGTDRNNEEKQDGIHITVGYMDRAMHDIDIRIYISGVRLDGFDLTQFWNIGVAEIPDHVKELMKDGWQQVLAKQQMCIPAPPDTEFPAIWKENVIDCTPKSVIIGASHTHGQYQPSFTPTWAQVQWRSILTRSRGDYDIDRKKAHHEFKQFLSHPQCEYEDLKTALYALEHLGNMLQDGELEMLDICMRNDLKPDQLLAYIIKEIVSQEKVEEEETKETKGKKKGNGNKVIDAKALQDAKDKEDNERQLRAAMDDGYGAWGH